MARYSNSFWITPNGLIAIALFAGVSYFLTAEHGGYAFEYLPLLIVLLCPVIHIFIHRGHSVKHSESEKSDEFSSSDTTKDTSKRGLEDGRGSCELG